MFRIFLVTGFTFFLGVNSFATPPLPRLTCTLTATPQTVKLGKSVTLSLATTGVVNSATINGVGVNVPNAKLETTPTAAGRYSASATVYGPTGKSSCQVTYGVQK